MYVCVERERERDREIVTSRWSHGQWSGSVADRMIKGLAAVWDAEVDQSHRDAPQAWGGVGLSWSIEGWCHGEAAERAAETPLLDWVVGLEEDLGSPLSAVLA